MAKILTVTPTPGESEAAFAARVASQADEFFGDEAAPAPVDDGAAQDVTDVPLDDIEA